MLAHIIALVCVTYMDTSIDVDIDDIETVEEIIQPTTESMEDDVANVSDDSRDNGALVDWRFSEAQGDDAIKYLSHAGEPVDINTASAISLADLPGLGPRDAEAIIAGRPYANIHMLVSQQVLDMARFEVIAPLLAASPPSGASSGSSSWLTQVQNRSRWRDDHGAATGLSVTSFNADWRLGAALTTEPQARGGALGTDDLALHDGFAQRRRGAHTFVLGYYDMGFSSRLTFDTTSLLAPDGLVRGASTTARRSPRLLGGAYSWRLHPDTTFGPTSTVFVATHASYRPLAGAHVAFAWDARNQLGLTGYAARAVASTGARVANAGFVGDANPGALGVAAHVGVGACDLASEGTLTAARALGYAVQGSCEPWVGLRIGSQWKDLETGFEQPFARVDRGRPGSNRRMVGVWTQLYRAPWHGSSQVHVSWPRACATDASPVRQAACPLPVWSLRHEGRFALDTRNHLRLKGRNWRGGPEPGPWNHSAALTWGWGGGFGLSGTLTLAWQRQKSLPRPAHMSASGRLGWRQPRMALGAYALTGLDAAHWRGGVQVVRRVSDLASLDVRAQMGQAGGALPLRYSAALVARVRF